MTSIELALGPCFFNWSPARFKDFYAAIADEAPIDRVYLGEVVCGKRMPFIEPVWPAVIDRLERGGKTVVRSLLALPATPRERVITAEAAAASPIVELNDMGQLADRGGRPFTAGPFLNVYNERTLALLRDRGCESWCPPVELPLADIAAIAHAEPAVAVELFAFGRLPLAVSARCYHARVHDRSKDKCRLVCAQDVDGLAVCTLDEQDFLVINGIQTLSHAVHVAAVAGDRLRQAGIKRLRLSPQDLDMAAVARGFRAMLDGRLAPAELTARLEAQGLPGEICNGYVSGAAGIERVSA